MEERLVLYRKYRPRGFDEVVGQTAVVRALSNALETGRVAHAFLFSGPHGVGKTTVARLIAKAVNCAKLGKSEAPCNKCESCERYNAGAAMDVIEIDAASSRGIDEIRELREAVRYAAAEGGKKTYIIDEVHMLTTPAFNALLKTLEEPPEHAIFILATTELDKVPATIISRTQHYQFKRPAFADIAARLVDLAKREKVKLSEEAAKLIALAAEGSLRDAESILGKILAVEDVSITEDTVTEILGMPRKEAVINCYRAMLEGDTKAGLEAVRAAVREGYDMGHFLKFLIRMARTSLIFKIAGRDADALADEFLVHDESVRKLAEAGDLAKMKKILQLLSETSQKFRRSPIPELPLELVILEASQ